MSLSVGGCVFVLFVTGNLNFPADAHCLLCLGAGVIDVLPPKREVMK